jgi:XisH protein
LPRKDRIHDAVKSALVRAGWIVTDDPFRIHYEDVDVYADLRIERTDGDNSSGALVIEIKSFLDESAVHSLETALGQYTAYRTLLDEVAPELKLYLAIADAIYESQFQRKSFQLVVQKNQVAMLVVDVVREEIVRWIN